MFRELTLIAATLGAVSCSSGTGVHVVVMGGGLTVDRLIVLGQLGSQSMLRTITPPQPVSLPTDFMARLPDQPTTVRFEVSGWLGETAVGGGRSESIDVTAHHLGEVTVALAAVGDGGVLTDDGGVLTDDGGAPTHDLAIAPATCDPGAAAPTCSAGSCVANCLNTCNQICSGTVDCQLTVGAGSCVVCRDQASCTLKCNGPCTLACLSPTATCFLTCPGGTPQLVPNGGSCP